MGTFLGSMSKFFFVLAGIFAVLAVDKLIKGDD